jgi:hypothetical protein
MPARSVTTVQPAAACPRFEAIGLKSANRPEDAAPRRTANVIGMIRPRQDRDPAGSLSGAASGSLRTNRFRWTCPPGRLYLSIAAAGPMISQRIALPQINEVNWRSVAPSGPMAVAADHATFDARRSPGFERLA